MKTFALILALLNPTTGEIEQIEIDRYDSRAECVAAAFEANLGAAQNNIPALGGACINTLIQHASA